MAWSIRRRDRSGVDPAQRPMIRPQRTVQIGYAVLLWLPTSLPGVLVAELGYLRLGQLIWFVVFLCSLARVRSMEVRVEGDHIVVVNFVRTVHVPLAQVEMVRELRTSGMLKADLNPALQLRNRSLRLPMRALMMFSGRGGRWRRDAELRLRYLDDLVRTHCLPIHRQLQASLSAAAAR